MTTLDELVLRITADTRQLRAELQKAGVLTNQTANQMKGAFAGLTSQLKGLIPVVSLAALATFTKRAIDAGDAINDMSKRTGVAVETLSKLDLAARQNGTSLEGVAQGIKFMNRNLAEAASGNKEAVKSFGQIGLSLTDLQKLSTEEQFLAVADQISRLGSASDRTKVAMDIFGRSGSDLIPIMEGGASAIRETMKEAERLGLVLSAEEAQRMDEFNDKWEEMTLRLQRLAQDGFLFAVEAAEKFSQAIDSTIGEAAVKWLELGTAIVEAQAMFGLVDRDVANAAADEAADRIGRIRGQGDRQSGSAPGAAPGPKRGPLKLTIGDSDEVKRAKQQLLDYVRAMEEEHMMAQLTQHERAALKAQLELLNIATKANIELSAEQMDHIGQLAERTSRLTEEMQEAARFAQELKDKLSDSLADVIINFDSATDSARRFAEEIAKTIIQKQITGPLAEGLIGAVGGSGFFSSLFGGGGGAQFGPPMPPGFASGGRPAVGRPSIVGERGPEIFVPDSAGTVVPNHALGGKQNNVTVVYNISPGVQGAVRAELMQAMPAITAQTKAAVFSSIERGGSEARAVNRRT